MKVSAIIVTRGNVDLSRILDSLPAEWEVLVWNNGAGALEIYASSDDSDSVPRLKPHYERLSNRSDLSVYGRYAAIEYASGDLVYVQDDDCIVSDPQAIVNALPRCDQPYVVWDGQPPTPAVHERTRCVMPRGHPGPHDCYGGSWPGGISFPQDEDALSGEPAVVCNMPPQFRHDFYQEHALVGFGACFHRDAPSRAFNRFWDRGSFEKDLALHLSMPLEPEEFPKAEGFSINIPPPRFFQRTCDIVFTVLTPRVLVDIPVENLPWATGPDRMYREPQHVGERKRMLELALKVRDL